MSEPMVRLARSEDVDAAAELVVRLKRLNGEFDPLFKVADDAPRQAKEYLSEALHNKDTLVLVCEMRGKVVGLVKADVRRRRFYEPPLVGEIVDFYVLPEFRRRGLGEELVGQAKAKLREKGAQIVTAEFPSQNQIAVSFYQKNGFRPVISVYATKSS